MSEKKFENPKDLFLFSLNQDMEKIYWMLVADDPKIMIEGNKCMCAFIQRLEIDNSETWKNLRWLQRNWTPDKGHYTNILHTKTYQRNPEMYDHEIWGIFRELSQFLNATYFRGWSGSKPQESKPAGKL